MAFYTLVDHLCYCKDPSIFIDFVVAWARNDPGVRRKNTRKMLLDKMIDALTVARKELDNEAK